MTPPEDIDVNLCGHFDLMGLINCSKKLLKNSEFFQETV